MEKIELNKCYMVKRNTTTLLFKVVGFTKRFDNFMGIELFEIYVSVGFETNSKLIWERNGLTLPVQDTNFVEIEEKELDKLEHAYKCARAIFDAAIKKLTPTQL